MGADGAVATCRARAPLPALAGGRPLRRHAGELGGEGRARPSADRIAALLADKGSDAVREELTKAGIDAVIPARRNRKGPAA